MYIQVVYSVISAVIMNVYSTYKPDLILKTFDLRTKNRDDVPGYIVLSPCVVGLTGIVKLMPTFACGYTGLKMI